MQLDIGEIMFVSYSLNDFGNNSKFKEFGYMCFKSDRDLHLLQDYLNDVLWKREPKIFQITQYSDAPEHYVYVHRKGVFRTIKWDHPLNSVDDICDLYIALHDKYQFTNILGFIPIGESE